MTPTFTPAQRTALASLDDRQIIALLGEILEPSQGGPICLENEAFDDVLLPIAEAYRDAFRAIQATLDCDVSERDLDADRADWLYDLRRDDARAVA